MASAETKLKSLAVSLGVDLVGVTTRDLLAAGPLSADPRYLLPSANSVISFALSLDRDILQDFISKKKWRPHCDNRKVIAQKLYTIGDTLAEQIRSEGYKAVNVDLNNNYPGWSQYWGKDDYFANFPVVTLEAAEWVAGIGLKGIGFDTISADSSDTQAYPIHKILLGSDMVIVENLANLDQLQAGPVEFICLPLAFQQADGSPIRAVAFI